MQTPADDIPGHELVSTGIADLEQGKLTVEALLVAVGAPRLKALGLAVPSSTATPNHPELALYHAIGRTHPEDAHSRYNALIRRLASYEHELERRRFRAARRLGHLATPASLCEHEP